MLHLPSAWRAASVDRSSVGSVGGVYNAPTCSRLSRNCAAACAGGAPKNGRDAVLDLTSSVGGIALATTARQEKSVLAWIAKPATAFGFATDGWTSRRLAELIVHRFGVRFNSNYLVEWLQARGHPPPSDPPP